MELIDYFRLVRRRWLWILGGAILGAAIAAGLSSAQTPQFSSTAGLFISTTSVDDSSLLQGGQFAQTRVQSYADLVRTRELAETVIENLGLDESPTELAGRVQGRVAVNTVNLSITVADADPHQAQRIAQGYAEAMTDTVRKLETPEGQTAAPVKATVVESATFSDNPVSPKPLRDVGLGIVGGLILAFGLALVRQTMDTRIRDADDLAEVTDRPVLGTIGYDSSMKDTPLISDIPSHSPRSEAFRVLRTNLQFIDVDTHNKVFVLSSAVPGEGKTTTSVNLAISLAEAGVRVLLVEGDLRRPRAAERLGLDGAAGVTTALVGTVPWQDGVSRHESGLDFLASGPVPPNPAELLQSKAMHELVAEVREKYDVVLIDAPPLLPVTDAALLAAHADGALLVIRHGRATREQFKVSARRLEQVDARLLGMVINMVPAKGRGYGYRYNYGYSYGYSPDLAGPDKRGKRRRGPD